MPISAAERASQQLNQDVDILLKQVDSAMAAPVLQLPAWFTRKTATPSCTVTELPDANQMSPASQSAQSTHRVVTPKLKAKASSVQQLHSSTSQSLNTTATTATSAAKHQTTILLSEASTAAAKWSTMTFSETDKATGIDSIKAAHDMEASEPDDLSILRFACSVTPSQSEDTATTITTSHPAQSHTSLSPSHWHTNRMADSEGSVSSTADSIHPAAAEAAASQAGALPTDAETSDGQGATEDRKHWTSETGSNAAAHSSKTSSANRSSVHSRLGTSKHVHIPNEDELDDPEQDQDQDHVHTENVAPGWHRQPLQNLSKGRTSSAKLAQPVSGSDPEVTSSSVGQGGLMEGYLRGSSAKLQLPASVRTGSRNSALSARTPLKTITEVNRTHTIIRSTYKKMLHLCWWQAGLRSWWQCITVNAAHLRRTVCAPEKLVAAVTRHTHSVHEAS